MQPAGDGKFSELGGDDGEVIENVTVPVGVAGDAEMSVTVTGQATDGVPELRTTRDGKQVSEVAVGLGLPITTFVPVSAETGMSPHIVLPETDTLAASTQELPFQYWSNCGGELDVMHTWAEPSAIPMIFTS